MKRLLLCLLSALVVGLPRSAAAAAPPVAPPRASPGPTPNPAPAPLVAPALAGDAAAAEEPPEQPEPPTLESKIPPVSGRAFTKAGKVEITVGVGLSLNDAFWEKFIPELSVGYHFNDNFYLGLRGGYAFDTGAGRVSACTTTAAATVCASPSDNQLKQLPGNFTATGAVEFAWTPIYGKLNFSGEKVIHFDSALLLDGGLVVLQTPGAVSSTGASTQNTSIAAAFAPGLGERFFFSSAVALSAELRDLIYGSGGVQNQLVFHLGLTFLL